MVPSISMAVIILHFFIGQQLGDDVELAVCTIEKANIIVNQLIDQQRKHQLIMIVIDEIHLISDSKRGFLLEVLLSKVVISIASWIKNHFILY